MSKSKYFPASQQPFYRIDVKNVEWTTFAKTKEEADAKLKKAGAGKPKSMMFGMFCIFYEGKGDHPMIDAGGSRVFNFLTNDAKGNAEDVSVVAKDLDHAIKTVGTKFMTAERFLITAYGKKTRFVR